MHLIGGGVAKLVYQLITVDIKPKDRTTSKFYYKNTDKSYNTEGYPFFIKSSSLKVIGETLEKSRASIPTSFQGSWDNIINKLDGVRMIDYIDFLVYAVPTIVCPMIENEEAQKALYSLSLGCSLALQWEIDEKMIKKMEM